MPPVLNIPFLKLPAAGYQNLGAQGIGVSQLQSQ